MQQEIEPQSGQEKIERDIDVRQGQAAFTRGQLPPSPAAGTSGTGGLTEGSGPEPRLYPPPTVSGTQSRT